MSQSPISDKFPPEELLDSECQLIKAAVSCIDDIESIREYVGYENGH